MERSNKRSLRVLTLLACGLLLDGQLETVKAFAFHVCLGAPGSLASTPVVGQQCPRATLASQCCRREGGRHSQARRISLSASSRLLPDEDRAESFDWVANSISKVDARPDTRQPEDAETLENESFSDLMQSVLEKVVRALHHHTCRTCFEARCPLNSWPFDFPIAAHNRFTARIPNSLVPCLLQVDAQESLPVDATNDMVGSNCEPGLAIEWAVGDARGNVEEDSQQRRSYLYPRVSEVEAEQVRPGRKKVEDIKINGYANPKSATELVRAKSPSRDNEGTKPKNSDIIGETTRKGFVVDKLSSPSRQPGSKTHMLR